MDGDDRNQRPSMFRTRTLPFLFVPPLLGGCMVTPPVVTDISADKVEITVEIGPLGATSEQLSKVRNEAIGLAEEHCSAYGRTPKELSNFTRQGVGYSTYVTFLFRCEGALDVRDDLQVILKRDD